MHGVETSITRACERMERWLVDLPEWPTHPTNVSGSVSSHFGPTILSEHDCVMHFARFLAEAGVAWQDIHLEFSPGQWIYTPVAGSARPKRIDLAILDRDRLAEAKLRAMPGDFRLDAVVEFALASNYWLFGAGSAATARRKVRADIDKVGEYLRSGLAERGYVVVIEECDHHFPADLVDASSQRLGVDVRLLRQWRQEAIPTA